jgi:hypothetical protein
MSKFRFSRRTVIAAIEMLERLEQVELTRYLLKLGPDFSDLAESERVSVPQCLNNLIRLLDQWPDQEIQDGQLLRDALIEKAVALIPYMWPERPDAVWETFQRALELDGFVITDGVLRRTLPADVGLPTAETETTRLLQKHGLTTAKGHPQGAHPGLSDEEDCTFRLHVVLLTGRLLLTRFDAQVGP